MENLWENFRLMLKHYDERASERTKNGAEEGEVGVAERGGMKTVFKVNDFSSVVEHLKDQKKKLLRGWKKS